MEKIWDLKPEGGGDPILVDMHDASEAIARDPVRYSRKPPEGSVAHGIAQKKRDYDAKMAEILLKEQAEMDKVNEEAKAKADAVRKAAYDAKVEADKKAAEEAAKNQPPPDAAAQVKSIEAEAAAKRAEVKAAHDEERKALEKEKP